tara:strand:- start:139 stop:285 length:147 start_codon:yes stop_codon:yes gene_type:complete
MPEAVMEGVYIGLLELGWDERFRARWWQVDISSDGGRNRVDSSNDTGV